MENNKVRKRRRRGEGGLRQLDNGKYEGTFVIVNKNGKTREKSFTRDTIDEINIVKAKLRLLGVLENDVIDIKIDRHTNEIKLIKQGQSKSSGGVNNNMTVAEYVKVFLFEHRQRGERGRKIEDTTLNTYIDRCKLIEQYLGNKKVADLTFEDIENCINNIHSNTTCDTTAKQARDIMKSLMGYAKKDGIIEKNVLEENKINLKEHKGKKEKMIIERDDIETFVNYCKEHKHYDMILLLFTGIRRK